MKPSFVVHIMLIVTIVVIHISLANYLNEVNIIKKIESVCGEGVKK